MSHSNLQQAADQERGKPPIYTVLGLVFAVAFVLLALSFLMDIRNNTEGLANSSETLATVIEERQQLRTRVAELEQRLEVLERESLAAQETITQLETERYFLERRIDELIRETKQALTERAALFDRPLGAVVEEQGSRLSNLSLAFTRFDHAYYYDRSDGTYYLVALSDLPLESKLAAGYMSQLSRFFGEEDYREVLSELNSVVGTIYSFHWVSDEDTPLHYYEKDFELEGQSYLLRLYTDESDTYDGTALFELTLIK